jgi:hypothetical protein
MGSRSRSTPKPPGSPEAQPLGLRDTALMAVSATGELAVLVRPDWVPGMVRGTLAVVPGAGGTPREVAENIVWADWSPTGDLAVIRFQNGRMQLEFPLGKVLLESNGLLFNPRVSPDGDSVAVLENGEMKLLDRTGKARILDSGNEGTHLAWAPSGEEVWFTGRNDAAIWATSVRTGERRLVYQGISGFQLEDISRDGRVLVNGMERRREVAVALPGNQPEIRLSVYDSSLTALSEDGRQVLLTSRQAGMSVRPTDGSAPLKLGPGFALALSPDAKWVLAEQEGRSELVLLPIGPEPARYLAVDGMLVNDGRFFHDGNRIVFDGRHREDKQYRLYTMSLDGGTPVVMSDVGVFGHDLFQVSLDDLFVAAVSLDEILTLYPTDGGPPVPLRGLGKNAEAVAWTPEGHLWVRQRRLRELPSRILLYDVAHQRVLGERAFSLNDATGILAVFHTHSTPDAGAIAFDYERVQGHLYVLDGLAALRR